MNAFLNSILRPYKKIIDKGDEDGSIPHDVLMPLISISDFEKLCLYASDHFLQQEIILSIPSDVYVVGDLHGNILDLLRILKFAGDLSKSRILFLGDYVDRGQFSIEVITLLFCLACLYPDNIFLIRGNHEFSKVNEIYGFKQQIIDEFNSDSPWKTANSAFDNLPLAAIIDKKIFCVHGGITPSIKRIVDIKSKFKRPIDNFDDNILYDLMWGDPTKSCQSYVPSLRGIGNQFGSFALNQFLLDNNFIQMIRGHQCVPNGVERLFNSKLVTVFSSSNYGEIPKGKAGFLLVNSDLTSKNFILFPYDIIVDRKGTHFVPINTNTPLLPLAAGLNIKVPLSPILPLAQSLSRNANTSRFSRTSARLKPLKLSSGATPTKPHVKGNSFATIQTTFKAPMADSDCNLQSKEI